VTASPTLDWLWTATGWHEVANERAYVAPADPRRLLWVAPESVDRFTGGLRLDVGLGRVQAGDWDRSDQCGQIRETAGYRGLRQRFDDGLDWDETALYEQAKRRIDDAGQVRGYETIEQFERIRCAYLDDLYESIRIEGYRPNANATHDNPGAEETSFEDAYAHHLEPLAAIGRAGEVFWAEGYHRFALADILEVDEIPVQILCRHRQWQRVRDAVAESAPERLPTGVEADADHPDLQDLETQTVFNETDRG